MVNAAEVLMVAAAVVVTCKKIHSL